MDGLRCNHTWEFVGLPNEEMMLVLNMTEPPLDKDIIKLYGEDFIDDSQDPYCKILDFTYRSFDNQHDKDVATKIHKEFPGCKLRSGVSPPAKLTFVGRQHFWVPPEFVIEYRVVPVLLAKPATTAGSTLLESTTVSTDVTTPSTKEPVDRTGFMTIILAVLGGIVLLLLIFLGAALCRRQRRLKHRVEQQECQMSNFYQSVPDSLPKDNGQIYDQISNVTKPVPKLKKKSKKELKKETVSRTESAKDVVNPLYEPQVHSYEYIDINITNGRNGHRVLPV
ncbi:uncharacterized protein LOC144424507 isoform X2 [Styela clava]